MVELATIARKDGMIALENQEISNRMLAKGVTALVDGNDANFIRASLERDTLITSQRHESARSIFQSWGDTAPAMGMIGTLIGLVILLKNLEDDPWWNWSSDVNCTFNYSLWSNFGKWRL